jgi:hypothetical protein
MAEGPQFGIIVKILSQPIQKKDYFALLLLGGHSESFTATADRVKLQIFDESVQTLVLFVALGSALAFDSAVTTIRIYLFDHAGYCVCHPGSAAKDLWFSLGR